MEHGYMMLPENKLTFLCGLLFMKMAEKWTSSIYFHVKMLSVYEIILIGFENFHSTGGGDMLSKPAWTWRKHFTF
jgi:hypothetical protein